MKKFLWEILSFRRRERVRRRIISSKTGRENSDSPTLLAHSTEWLFLSFFLSFSVVHGFWKRPKIEKGKYRPVVLMPQENKPSSWTVFLSYNMWMEVRVYSLAASDAAPSFLPFIIIYNSYIFGRPHSGGRRRKCCLNFRHLQWW